MTQSSSTSLVPTSTRTPSIPWTATMSFTSTPLHTSSRTIQTMSMRESLTLSLSISARTADATVSHSGEASPSPSSSHTTTATLTLSRWLSASTTLSLSKTKSNTQHSDSSTPTAQRRTTESLQPTETLSLSKSMTLTPSISPTMEATATKSPPTRSKSSTRFDCSALAWGATSVALVQVNTSDVTRAIRPSFSHNSTFFPLMGSTTNESKATRQDQTLREATPFVFLTSQDVDRLTLLQAPSLLFNLTLASANQLVYYYVGNVTTIQGTNVCATWSVRPRSGVWHGVAVEAPSSGWVRDGVFPVLLYTELNLLVPLMCGDGQAMLTVVLTVSSPGVPRVLASEVRRATQAALIAALLAAGAVSGSALGRILATDGTVLCDADAAGGGGVIDFDLAICVESPGLVEARSAILSNFAVVAAVCVLLLLMAMLWSAVTNLNSSSSQSFACTATDVFLLPSSLLPVLTTVMPSTAVSTTFLAACIAKSPCVGVDALLIVLGLLLIIAPISALACLTVNAAACWTCAASPPSPHDIDNKGKLRTLKLYLQRATRRGWKWRTQGSAASLRPAWVVLLEYRVLWYAAVDA
ncbi:GP46-like surface antigen, putative, partial [Bodo saltans]